MCIEFASKPVGPIRYPRDPMNMGERCPDESVFRACQQRSARTRRRVAGSELFRDRYKMTQGLLATGELYRAFETLRVAFETDSNWLYAWPFHHEPVSESDCRADGRNLRVTADHGNELGFSLPGWIWQHFADKAVESQPDAGGCPLCAFYVGQPAESKVSVFLSDSFFSCVRI